MTRFLHDFNYAKVYLGASLFVMLLTSNATPMDARTHQLSTQNLFIKYLQRSMNHIAMSLKFEMK